MCTHAGHGIHHVGKMNIAEWNVSIAGTYLSMLSRALLYSTRKLWFNLFSPAVMRKIATVSFTRNSVRIVAIAISVHSTNFSMREATSNIGHSLGGRNFYSNTFIKRRLSPLAYIYSMHFQYRLVAIIQAISSLF